jgi:N-acetylmuramoyl-L-alanine amidase
MRAIAIYAGHGGSDRGATADGYREKDITLAIANATSEILRGYGFTVINNHVKDTERSITEDAKLANEKKVDAVIEIHMNSNDGEPGDGSEAFISVRDVNRGGQAKQLANAILQRLTLLGFRNRGIFTSVNVRKQDTFGILRLTLMPAVLLEIAFINNPQDMARLNVPAVARAIADGVRATAESL